MITVLLGTLKPLANLVNIRPDDILPLILTSHSLSFTHIFYKQVYFDADE